MGSVRGQEEAGQGWGLEEGVELGQAWGGAGLSSTFPPPTPHMERKWAPMSSSFWEASLSPLQKPYQTDVYCSMPGRSPA